MQRRRQEKDGLAGDAGDHQRLFTHPTLGNPVSAQRGNHVRHGEYQGKPEILIIVEAELIFGVEEDAALNDGGGGAFDEGDQ